MCYKNMRINLLNLNMELYDILRNWIFLNFLSAVLIYKNEKKSMMIEKYGEDFEETFTSNGNKMLILLSTNTILVWLWYREYWISGFLLFLISNISMFIFDGFAIRKRLRVKSIIKEMEYEQKIENSIDENEDETPGEPVYIRKPIPQNVKDQVWNRDGGKCVECGSKERLEFDHIIPHSKGGADTYRNLQLLCQSCNGKKSNKIG